MAAIAATKAIKPNARMKVANTDLLLAAHTKKAKATAANASTTKVKGRWNAPVMLRQIQLITKSHNLKPHTDEK